jgi:hypothetical protein
MPLEVEHIVPRAKGGRNDVGNLCLACPRCNRYKGRQTEAIDDVTGDTVALYNPRQQNWRDHFAWQDHGSVIVGLTPVGRATILALQMNNLFVRRSRELWIENGWHPPQD